MAASFNNSTATRAVEDWLLSFERALQLPNTRLPDACASLFCEEECFWRDLLSFTWTLTTLEGRAAIKAMLCACSREDDRAFNWRIDGKASESEEDNDGTVVEANVTFETNTYRGKGHLRLRGGQCWTLLTTMQELKGHQERAGALRPTGVDLRGAVAGGRETWKEALDQERASLGVGDTQQPFVVIVGGGQGGIVLGARLRRLGVPAIILESNKRAGDSWRKRYKSLVLHDPVWYDHLPFMPFPDNWPVFTPKDKMGAWLESYASVMELNYWTESRCLAASFAEHGEHDEEHGEQKEAKGAKGGKAGGGGGGGGSWRVRVSRSRADGSTEEVVLKPTHLVLATGMSGRPFKPELLGAAEFQESGGDLHHSSEHYLGEGGGGGNQYAGKRCVVVGSNTSAHDLSQALWEGGASSVTLVQRSSSLVAKSETLLELALGDLYSEQASADGRTTEDADLAFASVPYRLMPRFHTPLWEKIAKKDALFYAALQGAGFLCDFGDDGKRDGLFLKYLRRGSGYYIDVGASQLIIDKAIQLESGCGVERLGPGRAVRLENGKLLPADVVVLATGFRSMECWAAELISQEVADKVGKVWGLGSGTRGDPGPFEGELRNMWKPTKQANLWFMGGNLHQARHYSQFLALQLKARFEAIPTPVYERVPEERGEEEEEVKGGQGGAEGSPCTGEPGRLNRAAC